MLCSNLAFARAGRRRDRQCLLLLLALLATLTAFGAVSPKQLEKLRQRFPQADANGDGRLTVEEAEAYRRTQPMGRSGTADESSRGAPREFAINPGWESARFPDHAVCYKSPEEIRAIYASQVKDGQPAVVSYAPPGDGALRVIGTGHSFMAPGYKTLPLIGEAAGIKQPLYTHTGGGMTGSTRYKWEQENGIFEFEGRPVPKLLASLANATWDVMLWGPYFKDRPKFYACWIDFCLKYSPHMKFYLSDAWPQLYQLDQVPKSEAYFTAEVFARMGAERSVEYNRLVQALRQDYPERVFILPTSAAMVLAAQHYLRGELPGIEGINRIIGGKERSLWRDQLGHLGPGLERLEGYVFYATIYGRSPERIEGEIDFRDTGDFPSRELDRLFRRIAWQAVVGHPLSGVRDANGDGMRD